MLLVHQWDKRKLCVSISRSNVRRRRTASLCQLPRPMNKDKRNAWYSFSKTDAGKLPAGRIVRGNPGSRSNSGQIEDDAVGEWQSPLSQADSFKGRTAT